MNKKKFHIKTFGCQMNVYDSLRITDILFKIGYKEVSKDLDADISIINTCHIRDKAKQKLYSELGKKYKIKKSRNYKGKNTLIIVAGCVAQAEGEEIFNRAPYVDLVVGSQSYQNIPNLLKKRFLQLEKDKKKTNLIQQAINLALLSQNLLKGENLTKYIENSFSNLSD